MISEVQNLTGVLLGSGNLEGNLSSSSNLEGTLSLAQLVGIKNIILNGETLENVGGTVTINLDYEDLAAKPQINGIQLIGNKSFSELGMNRITNNEIDTIMEG